MCDSCGRAKITPEQRPRRCKVACDRSLDTAVPPAWDRHAVLFFAGKGRYEILVGSPSNMKIATFNINNINKRLANLLAWLDAAKPDVVCLQELKAADAQFPA